MYIRNCNYLESVKLYDAGIVEVRPLRGNAMGSAVRLRRNTADGARVGVGVGGWFGLAQLHRPNVMWHTGPAFVVAAAAQSIEGGLEAGMWERL